VFEKYNGFDTMNPYFAHVFEKGIKFAANGLAGWLALAQHLTPSELSGNERKSAGIKKARRRQHRNQFQVYPNDI